MIVVDASVVLEAFLGLPAAASIERWLFDPNETLHAPHLLDVEVAHVVRRYAGMGVIDSERGRMVLDDFSDLEVKRYGHGVLLPRIWELRHNLTAYDAAYVSLAELLEAPLLTRDQRLASTARQHVRVELF